jgi:hypothetical protein
MPGYLGLPGLCAVMTVGGATNIAQFRTHVKRVPALVVS